MHRRQHILLCLLVLSTLAASCIKDTYQTWITPYPIDNSGKIQIKPTVDTDWVPVKSGYDPIDDESLKDEGFGVIAYYTGSEDFSTTRPHTISDDPALGYAKFGTVLNNRQFLYNESGGYWYYAAPEEYWPTAAGEHLTFFAYAPWSWHESVNTSGPVPYIPYTVAPDLTVASLEAQRDLLWGTDASGFPHRDVQASDFTPNGTVDMHFRHALAKLHFTISGLESDLGEREMYYTDIVRVEGNWPADDTDFEIRNEVTTVADPEGDTPQYVGTITSTGSWLNRQHSQTAEKVWRFKKTIETEEYQEREVDVSQSSVAEISGKRYLLGEVSLQGLNQSGLLLLDNFSAGEPEWQIGAPGESQNYQLLSSNTVMEQSLRRVDDDTFKAGIDTYTGVTMDPKELMTYPLYALPRAAGSGSLNIRVTYHTLDISTDRTTPMNDTVTGTRTRSHVETWQFIITVSATITWNGGITTTSNRPSVNNLTSFFPTPAKPSSDDNRWVLYTDSQPSWDDPPPRVSLSEEDPEWVEETPYYADFTIDDTDVTLEGSIPGLFEGGKSYTINLLLSGDRIELQVTPRPWTLEDQDFEYKGNINPIIQALTYDGNTVDHADYAGNVFIDNRMAHFYFQLGAGKYIGWQAILVGDTAFGFTDSNGEFLKENGERVASISGTIDPAVRNDIYIRAIDDGATVTSRAKLRIYYIDSNGEATAALNLVNMDGVTEWTIVQNAN